MEDRPACGILPPRSEMVALGYGFGRREEGISLECILPQGTCYAHVFSLPDGRYISWEDDFECGCCEGDTPDRCIKLEEITSEQLEELKRQTG